MRQCNCENSFCQHSPDPCPILLGEKDEKVKAIYLGEICGHCSQNYDKKYLYPPHGTAKSDQTC